MLKRVLLLAAALLFTLLLSSCGTLELNVENILKPPKISELQAKISSTLARSVGTEYTLKYPKGGKYYSGYNFIDLNGDGVDEAIVFLKVNNTSYVQMALLYFENDDWHLSEIISDFGYANDVDFVDFSELGGVNTLMVGTQSTESTNTSVLAVYDISSDKLGRVKLEQNNKWDYSSLIIQDYNEDGKKDIIILDIADSFKGTPATMTVVELDENRLFSVKQFFNLYFPISEYLSVGIIKTGADTKAIAIDARLSNSYYTTAIYPIINGSVVEVELPHDSLLRTVPLTMSDVDNDKIYEIPIQVLAPGYNNSPQLSEYLIEYHRVNIVNDRLGIDTACLKRLYIDFTRGISFEFPERWLGLPISIYTYSNKGEILFFVNADGNVFDHSNEIFRLVISQDKSLPSSRHFVLHERGDTKYLGLSPAQPNAQFSKYTLSPDEAKSLFKIL